MNIFIQRCIPGLIAMMTMLLFSAPTMALNGRAAGDQFEMNINISGTVVATGSCTFNSTTLQGMSTVDFENVTFSSINGFLLQGNYRKTVDSSMTCTGDTEGTTTMTYKEGGGERIVDFNGHKLLGIIMDDGKLSNNIAVELLVNGGIMDFGTPFNFNIASPPVTEFALVQIGSSDTISNGQTFSTIATLTIEFQ